MLPAGALCWPEAGRAIAVAIDRAASMRSGGISELFPARQRQGRHSTAWTRRRIRVGPLEVWRFQVCPEQPPYTVFPLDTQVNPAAVESSEPARLAGGKPHCIMAGRKRLLLTRGKGDDPFVVRHAERYVEDEKHGHPQ